MKLYKYCSWNEQYTEHNLSKSQLYFSEASAFNDPFDLLPSYTYSLSGVAEQTNDTLRNDIGICCFTKKKDNLLMWAHYAENHKGFCLEFTSTDYQKGVFLDSKIEFAKVKYSSKRPICNQYSFEPFLNTLFTKSPEWSYENEYRAICLRGAGLSDYTPSCLSSIYLGCRMPCEHIEGIKKIFLNSEHHPNLYKMELDERKFKLNPVPINYQ